MGKWHNKAADFFSRYFGYVIASCTIIALIITASLPVPTSTNTLLISEISEEQRQNELFLRITLNHQMQQQISQVKRLLNTIAQEVENHNFDINLFLNEVEENCEKLRKLREELENIQKKSFSRKD
ncbi:MAG: hypothetical protein N2234_04985 [Planctomycetota bacterium]|nr:hypothetical protein [Planctomycetota bacterium]